MSGAAFRGLQKIVVTEGRHGRPIHLGGSVAEVSVRVARRIPVVTVVLQVHPQGIVTFTLVVCRPLVAEIMTGTRTAKFSVGASSALNSSGELVQ